MWPVLLALVSVKFVLSLIGRISCVPPHGHSSAAL